MSSALTLQPFTQDYTTHPAFTQVWHVEVEIYAGVELTVKISNYKAIVTTIQFTH